jgi:hypothetical protein
VYEVDRLKRIRHENDLGFLIDDSIAPGCDGHRKRQQSPRPITGPAGRLGAAASTTEKDGWRCELRVGPAGTNRLEVKGERLVTTEATAPGGLASYRSEFLRQRVLRGDLRTSD